MRWWLVVALALPLFGLGLGCGSVKPPTPHERSVVIRVEGEDCKLACARHARDGERVVECLWVTFDEEQWRRYEEEGHTVCMLDRRRPTP